MDHYKNLYYFWYIFNRYYKAAENNISLSKRAPGGSMIISGGKKNIGWNVDFKRPI